MAGLKDIASAKGEIQTKLAAAKLEEQQRQDRHNIAKAYPTRGKFKAPSLTFPYYKKKSHGGKKVMFFKYGRVWGIIVHPRTLTVDSEIPVAAFNINEAKRMEG